MVFMLYLSAVCKRLAMLDRGSSGVVEERGRFESASLRMSNLMVSLGSEREIGVSKLGLLGCGTENISLKTGDASDNKILRTQNRTPSDETMSTSRSLGLDIVLGAETMEGQKRKTKKSEN
jgi:hypothetical protein